MILCLAASPSVDKLFELERVEVGRIHRPRSFVQVPGGKGLNVARAAHALGADVVATGILAGHAGRWIEQALADEGVRGTATRSSSRRPTPRRLLWLSTAGTSRWRSACPRGPTS